MERQNPKGVLCRMITTEERIKERQLYDAMNISRALRDRRREELSQAHRNFAVADREFKRKQSAWLTVAEAQQKQTAS
jgi:hypothetical protein